MRPTIMSSAAGAAGLMALGAGGTKLTIWYITALTLSPVNGAAPVSISYRITPSEKMSERWSARLPITCSGDMYFGEPIIMPVCVCTLDERMRAMPKSVIFTGPLSGTMMFAGLMSRCTTPRSCA